MLEVVQQECDTNLNSWQRSDDPSIVLSTSTELDSDRLTALNGNIDSVVAVVLISADDWSERSTASGWRSANEGHSLGRYAGAGVPWRRNMPKRPSGHHHAHRFAEAFGKEKIILVWTWSRHFDNPLLTQRLLCGYFAHSRINQL